MAMVDVDGISLHVDYHGHTDRQTNRQVDN